MTGIVWGKFLTHANDKLEEIIADYIKLGVKVTKRVSNHYQSYVVFNNDDRWEAVSMRESAKGKKANISYIENTIPDDFIRTIILPATTRLPYVGIHRYTHPGNNKEETNAV